MTSEKEEICRKLRAINTEFSYEEIKDAVIIGPDIGFDEVSGHEYIRCETLGSYHLGNVSFEIARFFEDI